MKRRLPAAVNMIVELAFVASVMLILFGAFNDLFVNHPLLSAISVLGFCLSIVSWAYFQDA